MSLLNFFIPLSDITCNFPCQAAPSILQRAAQLIINGEGVINPLILRPIGMDHYELVDGVFEYYAAVEAEKIEPMRNELINSYIIKPEQEQIFANQIETFRQRPPLETNKVSDKQPDKESETLQQVLNKVDELTAEVKFLKSMVEQLVANSMGNGNDANPRASSAVITPVIMANQLPIVTTSVAMDTQDKIVSSTIVEASSTITHHSTPPITSTEDVFTVALEPTLPIENENVVSSTITPQPIRAEALPSFTSSPVVTPLALTPIEKLNNMGQKELALFLTRHKFNKPIIKAMLDQQRPFASFDAIKIKGFGEATKRKLIAALEI